MLLLGIDIGTSFIKVSVVDAISQKTVFETQYPETESKISSPQIGWAEQEPEDWWHNTQKAIQKATNSSVFDPQTIAAIGISYQMHGLVVIDQNQHVLRPSIIWCDSRAVSLGKKAFETIGKDFCLQTLLNSPGNFTAAKLAWVKQNQPEIYEQIYKIMLPGDFIAMKLTGEVSTTASALSEGIFWNFKENKLSEEVLTHFGFDCTIIPDQLPVFTNHGKISNAVAKLLNINQHAIVSYKAGDQPNNAVSLNVFEPGEVAATAGTSGVIYAVSDQVMYDPQTRVNSFAHVNHLQNNQNRLGILLCINGTGILNNFVKSRIGNGNDYNQMNDLAQNVPIGSEGLRIIPFGNGAERVLNNKIIGSQFLNIDFNKHSQAHFFRAAQEGIAMSFNYGFEIMKTMGVKPKTIKAGKSNLFLSNVFINTLVNVTQQVVELYDTNGSKGAALAAGIGAGIYKNNTEAFYGLTQIDSFEPNQSGLTEYEALYENWKDDLSRFII